MSPDGDMKARRTGSDFQPNGIGELLHALEPDMALLSVVALQHFCINRITLTLISTIIKYLVLRSIFHQYLGAQNGEAKDVVHQWVVGARARRKGLGNR